MTIQFPDTPSQGDTFESSNGVTYTYDNGGWTANNPVGLNDLYVEVAGDTMTGTLSGTQDLRNMSVKLTTLTQSLLKTQKHQ
jgi:hypothetical protein